MTERDEKYIIIQYAMDINICLGDGEYYEGSISLDREVLDSGEPVVLTYRCNAERKEQDFFLDCQYTASTVFPCARCLRDAAYQTEGNIYVHCSQRVVEDDEEYVLRVSKGEVDLLDVLVKDLVLNMPFVHLCSEDCEGICGTCGTYKPCECVKRNNPFGMLKELLEQSKEE